MARRAYPVLETYKGVKIRTCNLVELRFGVAAFKKLIDECESTGLSIQKFLSHSSRPCEKCENVDVRIYDKLDNEIKVKRGFLFKHMPESNGSSITQKAHAEIDRVSQAH